ncbi:MAG: hypothetical protein FGM52_06005 [Mycobacterium sp.]|nr:hypothetical protein [Mycobacterium sp.]
MVNPDLPPPPGTTWTEDFDEQFHDRVYGGDPVRVGPIAALLTGVQHRTGSTVSGVGLRVKGTVIPGGAVTPGAEGAVVVADLTPSQARELADVLEILAGQAEKLDGIQAPAE